MSIESLHGGEGSTPSYSNSNNDLNGYLSSLDHILTEAEDNPDRAEEAKSFSNKIQSFIISEEERKIVSCII